MLDGIQTGKIIRQRNADCKLILATLELQKDDDGMLNLNDYLEYMAKNKIRKNPYGFFIWVGIASILHIVLFKEKVVNDYQIAQRILFAISAIVFTISIHELIHYFFMKIFSLRNVRIELAKDPSGLLSFRTVYEGDVSKWKKIIICLSPFVVLTLLLDIVFVFVPKVELFFFIVTVCNCVGCYYDLIDTIEILYKKENE